MERNGELWREWEEECGVKGEGRAGGVEMGDGGWQSIISCPELFFFAIDKATPIDLHTQ